MAEMHRCEGPLWRDGDGTPSVVVGTIEQHENRWSGEITLKGLFPQRALAAPADWRLHPQGYPVLRVRLTRRGGGIFTFEGVLNVEQSTMLFAKRKDDTYDVVPGGTMALAMPEDGIYLTVVGNTKVVPPAEKMTSEQMADWVRQLKATGYTLSARDGLGKALRIDI